jgi:hypothetical protein
MSVSINGTNGLVFNDGSAQATAASGFGFKNRIINGDMRIDQRNAGASLTHSGVSNFYGMDRMVFNSNGTPQFSVQRVEDAPPGFTFSAKLTTTTAGTPAAADFSYFGQYIEGFNVADFAFGTASATTVTISFWVKSSLTGTFGGSIRNGSNNRAYPFSFSINAVNTWEFKTVTVPGDVTGVWGKDNSFGLTLVFDTGSGANNKGTAGAWNSTANIGVTGGTNLVATAGATINITGVQLEKGSTATSFDVRPYGTELQLCQRYCRTLPATTSVGYSAGGNTLYSGGSFSIASMRTAPTLRAGSTYAVSGGNAGTVAIRYATTETVSFFNSANNWSTNADIAISTAAVLESEL